MMVSTTSLSERLRERIAREGPITFRDWMNASLYDAESGYYCRADRERWGPGGDYRTSPELTPLFAATFAGYFAKLYRELGEPAAWQIVECGAGNADFANDLLTRLERDFPQAFAAATYVVDEASKHSGEVARERLRRFSDRLEFAGIQTIKPGAGVVFANELLDAFPVHRVVLRDGEYREFYVTADSEGHFQWIEGDLSSRLQAGLLGYLRLSGVEPADGVVFEVNFGIEEWLGRVAGVLSNGFLIIVDYGAAADQLFSVTANVHGTLRGFRQHEFVDDLLVNPGEHDLTSTVNWSVVKSIAEKLGFELLEFAQQDQFLLARGFLEQLGAETAMAVSESQRLRLSHQAREMILPDGMSSFFQVMVLKKNS